METYYGNSPQSKVPYPISRPFLYKEGKCIFKGTKKRIFGTIAEFVINHGS